MSGVVWGPWVEHDGGPGPVHGGPMLCECEPDGRKPATPCDQFWPGFAWRWRRVRVGWFRTELRRVCLNPAYAPVIRYRLGRPGGEAALRQLARIAQHPDRFPVETPDVERRKPVPVREDA